MAIDAPAPLATVLGSIPADGSRWLADPEGAPPQAGAADGLRLGLVGPAPGLAPDERQVALDAGFVGVSLGPMRLRAETAAVSLAAIWAASI